MNKHIILTSGRSGSNYLSSLLNNHPNVINYGEVLGEWTTGYKVNKYLRLGQGDASSYLDYIYRGQGYFQLSQNYARLKSLIGKGKAPTKRWTDIQSFGVKDFAMTLIDRGAKDFLMNNPDIRVISLYRENALRRYASVIMLDETGVVSTDHAKSKTAAKKKRNEVYLPPDTFISGLRRTEQVVQDQQDMTNALDPSRVLSIRYEDLFSSDDSKRAFATKMFGFIDVEPQPLKSSHKKLNSDNLKELITNYDEVFEMCKGTDDERYFYY